MLRVADLDPATVGVKVTLMVQFAPAARVEPTAGHVLPEIAKSAALLPMMVMPVPLIVAAVVPLLVSVTV